MALRNRRPAARACRAQPPSGSLILRKARRRPFAGVPRSERGTLSGRLVRAAASRRVELLKGGNRKPADFLAALLRPCSCARRSVTLAQRCVLPGSGCGAAARRGPAVGGCDLGLTYSVRSSARLWDPRRRLGARGPLLRHGLARAAGRTAQKRPGTRWAIARYLLVSCLRSAHSHAHRRRQRLRRAGQHVSCRPA